MAGPGDGRTPIDEVNELLDVELPQEEWDTVGGLFYALLGTVPTKGRACGTATWSSRRSGCRAAGSCRC